MPGQTPGGEIHEGWLRLSPGRTRRSAQVARCVGFSKGFAVPVCQRELPSRYVTLIINFGAELAVVGSDRGRRRVGSFVSGLQTEPAVTERLGHQYGMHVRLTPLAAYSILGLPMGELTNALVELPTVLREDAAGLTERLVAARTWPDRFAAVEAMLARRMADGPRPDPAVAWAWGELRTSNGSARIQRLVERSGHSHRHLARLFGTQVGIPPKAVARVLRFEHSLALLREPRASLAAVATTAGYYDQAHLNREFRALAGSSPMELLATGNVRSDFSKTA